jgi:hypothetical protein
MREHRNRRFYPLGAALAVAGAMSGCAKSYVLVDASMERGRSPSQQRDVRQTDAYRTQKSGIQNVAFRFPDYCTDTHASAATGVNKAEAVLGSRCGVWLAELERATAREGYRIVSSDALVRLERQEGMSTYTAAKRLGAQLVFILNSLEVGFDSTAQQEGLTLSYYRSDPTGESLKRAELTDRERKLFRDFVAKKASISLNPGSPTAVKAVLDTTAINADTGESIWFYRMAVHKPVLTVGDTRLLFRGREQTWRPVRPEGMQMPTEGLNTRSSEDVIGYSEEQKADMTLKQEAFEIVRTIANDFSTSFRAGGR